MQIRKKEFITGKKYNKKSKELARVFSKSIWSSEATSTNWCRDDPARGLYAAIRGMIASLVEEQVERRS